RRFVAVWGERALEVIPAELVGAEDTRFRTVVARLDPTLAGESIPDRLALLAAEVFDERLPLDVSGQRTEPFAGGEVEEITEQSLGAELRVALVLTQCAHDMRQIRQGFVA